MTSPDSPLGPALALASAVGYGVFDFIGGMLSRRRPAAAVVGVSQAASLVVLLAIVAVVGLPDSWAWAPWAAVSGVMSVIAITCFYRALAFGTMGVVSPIAGCGVVITVVVGLLSGEQPSTGQLIGLALAIGGAVLASGPELLGEQHVKAQAIWFALVAAVGFGISVAAIARGSAISALATVTGIRVVSVAIFAVAAIVLRSLGGIRPREVPLLALVGLGDVGSTALLGVATTLGLLSLTSVLSALYPVVTVGLAAVVLNERLRPVQWIGVAIALAGVALITLR